ncbi:MAG: hypothetical protein M3O70_20765 [Actinomycetota bacterium]|nr:hypothetical protein [Actinomycetota bacterium]
MAMPMLPLAHAGGLDELMVFAAPVLLYMGVRWWERRHRDDDHNGGRS